MKITDGEATTVITTKVAMTEKAMCAMAGNLFMRRPQAADAAT
jgi:hypothetical protein